jgi:hypothetical protein
MNPFRPKKKVGQIYINIPGEGCFSVESYASAPTNLNPALKAARKAFWKAYKKMREGK